MSKKFSHLDDDNNPSMVDISSKLESKRIAKAYAKAVSYTHLTLPTTYGV